MDRIVLRLMCDDRGEISFLFGSWGVVNQAEAISEIESGKTTYALQRQDGSRTPFTTTGRHESKRLSVSTLGTEILGPNMATRMGS
jgi:hypothetical protein